MEDSDLRRLLSASRGVAVVGMSRNASRSAHRVPAFLIRSGYRVVPVNPFADEILGRQCYGSLMAVPGQIDIVDVFRPSEDAYSVVEEAVRRHQERGDVDLIWLQLGVVNERARALAAEASISFVQDRCMEVEILRLFPAGIDATTGV